MMWGFFLPFFRQINFFAYPVSVTSSGYTKRSAGEGAYMNQSYGRLVSRAAIAATAMASALLLIKIFAWWYTGSVSILAALVDSLVDQSLQGRHHIFQ